MYKYANNCFYPYMLMASYQASGTWPEGGVDVNEDVFQKFIQSAPGGMCRGTGGDGMPCWEPLPPKSLEELASEVRVQRNYKLGVVDSIGPVRWASMSDVEKQEWVIYRLALLDVPQQEGFPVNIVWPIEPNA